MRCLKKVEGMAILNKVRNVDIRSRLGQVAVSGEVDKVVEEDGRNNRWQTGKEGGECAMKQLRPRKRWTDDLRMN